MNPDRYTMIWQLTLNTKFDENYLLNVSDKELTKLWEERVGQYERGTTNKR
ncbi:hypothetical protein LC087_19085 (plasmid) [Bacillus carboniphilus]|uniref:Uncharacterized protein n=1 Tax=Bacillus carboniphilus TaxID=86663 RepID=A0ABY9K126_9BACI|nr:hypothetical protein [Bacillus carboniphilus]WLR44413.1 hypothetical protein LC087_19085 [Bacillus carboniphilus]